MAGVSRQRTGIPGRDALDHHAARAAFAVEVRLPAPSLRANGSAPTGRANARPMTGAAPPDDRLRGVDASPNSADRRPRIVAFNRVSRDRGGFDTGLAVWARLVRNLVPIANVFLFRRGSRPHGSQTLCRLLCRSELRRS